MEAFEQIRREYEHGEGTIIGVAKKLGIHRRMVREALADAVPKERKKRFGSGRSWHRQFHLSIPSLKQTSTPRANRGTRHIAFGDVSGMRFPILMWQSQRFASMCVVESTNWD